MVSSFLPSSPHLLISAPRPHSPAWTTDALLPSLRSLSCCARRLPHESPRTGARMRLHLSSRQRDPNAMLLSYLCLCLALSCSLSLSVHVGLFILSTLVLSTSSVPMRRPRSNTFERTVLTCPQGDGGVYFSTLSPASYRIGDSTYEENILVGAWPASGPLHILVTVPPRNPNPPFSS